MQTVIVPVDFSPTSINAAEYAVQLLTGHYGLNIILYHIYDKASDEQEVTKKLEELSVSLREKGVVKTEVLARQGSDFIEELDKLARHRDADLIIMGITGRSAIGQTLIGSNTLKMVEKNTCPVMIIPPDCQFRDVNNVLLTSDFQNAKVVTPSVPIKKILKTFKPNFFIINVNEEHYVSITEEFQKEKADLAEMFKEFNPEFFFLGLPDVKEAIDQFTIDRNIDLIIIVHKEQNALSKMFVKSYTKKLAYESSVPILAVHE